MQTLERAIAIASEAHAGQVDKACAPYILHPRRVMMAVETETDRIVAVLHDVLEDRPAWTGERLIAEGFGYPVITALDALTRREGEAYDAFIDRLSANPIARRVKRADLADNMDLRRIANPQPGDYRRLEKYQRASARLA